MPDNWGVGKSENGWMTSESFYEYVTNIFFPWILKNGIKLPVVLYVDGHKSHLTLSLSEFCRENGIILISLLPNSTHILQPLDVGVFHPLKSQWKLAVEKWRLQNKKQTLKKENFGPLLKGVLDKTFKSDKLLKNSFRVCGLFPFNANAVDYSKILCTPNSSFDSTENNIQQNEISKEAEVSKETLKFIETYINEDTLKKFYDSKEDAIWNGNVEDSTLFDLWKKIYKDCQVSEKEIFLSEEDNESIILNENTGIDKTVSLDDSLIIEADWINDLIEENQIYIESPTAPTGPDSVTLEESNTQEKLLGSSHEETVVQKIEAESQTKSNLLENKNHTNEKLTSGIKQTIPSPFKSVLFWPNDNTNSNQKRKHKEKVPSVCSSEKWKQYYERKESLKLQKHEELLERKRKRQEKKELKENKQEGVKKKLFSEEDTILNKNEKREIT